MMRRSVKKTSGFALPLAVLLLAACGSEEQGEFASVPDNPFPSSYTPKESEPVMFTNAIVYDGRGGMMEGASILVKDGKIQAYGQNLPIANDAKVIDAAGRFVTPGIIDVHSHLGVYPNPSTSSHADGNEVGEPVTADAWAEHSIWPQDPGFVRAAAGGVTAMQILPGSANLVGGRTVTLKNVPGRVAQNMKFPGAPYGVKMACGENPKRVYGSDFSGGKLKIASRPHTRMGNVAGYRQAFADAENYRREWEKYRRDYNAGKDVLPPKRDLKMDTMAGILDGDIIVHMHCYRADDMGTMLDVMKEFNYRIGTFHHAVESYKIADKLAADNVCSAMWADWWGFKMEAYDGIEENIAFVHNAGACAIVHSDSDEGIQRLNQEAAKALAAGQRAGLEITKAEAWQWLSLNPARSLGVDKMTGSIEVGKQADLVLWSADPFSVYAKADLTLVDGAIIWDRSDAANQAITDFELGQFVEGEVK